MPVTIYDIMCKQFSPTLLHLSQQKESRFATRVRRETVRNAEDAYFDTVGPDDDPQVDNDHKGQTPDSEGNYGRRKVTPQVWEKGRLLDAKDIARMQADPQGATTQSFAMSFGRKKDKIILAAAVADARIGKEGGSTVAFKDESIGIKGDGTATTLGTLATPETEQDMSLEKMLLMMKIFNLADVDPDIPKYWAITPQDIEEMLLIVKLTSADYSTLRALQAGQFGDNTVCGFRFIWSNLIESDTTDASCNRTIAWAQDGIILAYIGDLTTQMAPDPTRKFNTRIYSKMDLGAVRMEGAKVHECLNSKIHVADA